MTKEEIAQWVIDNRYAGDIMAKISDFEMYQSIVDEITKLIESENERLKAEREWISVKEQKPLTDEIIHVWHRNELKKGKRCIVGNNELWHYEGESRLSYEAPTHWMPLPQMPEL